MYNPICYVSTRRSFKTPNKTCFEAKARSFEFSFTFNLYVNGADDIRERERLSSQNNGDDAFERVQNHFVSCIIH